MWATHEAVGTLDRVRGLSKSLWATRGAFGVRGPLGGCPQGRHFHRRPFGRSDGGRLSLDGSPALGAGGSRAAWTGQRVARCVAVRSGKGANGHPGELAERCRGWGGSGGPPCREALGWQGATQLAFAWPRGCRGRVCWPGPGRHCPSPFVGLECRLGGRHVARRVASTGPRAWSPAGLREPKGRPPALGPAAAASPCLRRRLRPCETRSGGECARTRPGRGSRAWSAGDAGCTSPRCTRRSPCAPPRGSPMSGGRSAPS